MCIRDRYTIFEKIKYGNLRVIFPSSKIVNFNGNNSGVYADITLLNFLVIGEKPTNKKIKKAKELKIKILTQDEWIKMLNKTR